MTSEVQLAPADAEAQLDELRLDEEDGALRAVSPTEGALGRNASDYHQMWSLFMQIVERANSMNADPNAFTTKYGFNEKTLNAWTKMIATARSILEGLNKMRNADKMTRYILENYTRGLAQSVTIELGMEVKTVLDALDAGEDREAIAIRLKRFIYRRVPEIFLRSATETLASTKEEFSLLH